MRTHVASLLFFVSCTTFAADFSLPRQALNDPDALASAMPVLARQALARYKEDVLGLDLNNRFRLQLIAGDYAGTLDSLARLRQALSVQDAGASRVAYFQYELYARAMLRTDIPFEQAYKEVFENAFSKLGDVDAVNLSSIFVFDLARARADVERVLARLTDKPSIGLDELSSLVRAYQPLQVYAAILAPSEALLAQDEARRFIIDDKVLIKTSHGITLSAVVARQRASSRAQPGSLLFTIYPNVQNARYEAKYAAARAYVGIVADARGKRLGTGQIMPYEHETKDVNSVIDWITRQFWSDGRVVMHGGSYSGFAQWAAAKQPHPALKAMAPYAAALPGLGLPMENNVFLNANYGWAFYVGNHRMLDEAGYHDRQAWQDMEQRWFSSGRSYREIDKIEGRPNPLLQRWLKHPSYDQYWQAMTSYKQDYARIHIPVLSVTGYYDDAQVSALHIFREHLKYNPKAEHYLVIGPWDHVGLQRSRKPATVNDYAIDPVAQIDTPALTYAWFDHVLHGAPKPSLLKDRVNYQRMGANQWLHAPSIDKMATKVLTLYLSRGVDGKPRLSERPGSASCRLDQTVDFRDRQTTANDYYPYPVVGKTLDPNLGLSFVSAPFEEPMSIDGVFEGELKAIINKRDMDVGAVLYELMPDGRLFHLSYYLGRASYAQAMETRRLLTPGKVATIPFTRSRMTSRKLSKGSQLLVVIDVNKNPGAQLNYGTGGDVSAESIADAGEPLKVQWQCDSFVRIPISVTSE